MNTTDNTSVRKSRKKINKATAYKRQKLISKAAKEQGFIDSKQVAKICRVKLSTVRSWVRRGILKPVKWRQGGPFSNHFFSKKEVMDLHLFRQAVKPTSHRWICDSISINGKVHNRLNKYPNRKIHKKTLEKMKNGTL